MKKLLILAAATMMFAACSSTEETMEEKKDMAKQEMSDKKAETKAMMKDTEKKMTEKVETSSSDAQMTANVECSNQKDVRSLMVKKTTTGGCELMYKKFGSEKMVASSGISSKYCEQVSKKIQTNLSRSGFSCQ